LKLQQIKWTDCIGGLDFLALQLVYILTLRTFPMCLPGY